MRFSETWCSAKKRKSLSSRRVRSANIEWSNGMTFLMATCRESSVSARRGDAGERERERTHALTGRLVDGRAHDAVRSLADDVLDLRTLKRTSQRRSYAGRSARTRGRRCAPGTSARPRTGSSSAPSSPRPSYSTACPARAAPARPAPAAVPAPARRPWPRSRRRHLARPTALPPPAPAMRPAAAPAASARPLPACSTRGPVRSWRRREVRARTRWKRGRAGRRRCWWGGRASVRRMLLGRRTGGRSPCARGRRELS